MSTTDGDRDNRGWRVQALELAIKTVANVQNFTNFQVVHTAKLYEAYIFDGTVPPITVAEAQKAAPHRFEGDDLVDVDRGR